jgi:hypothetical protein
MSLFASQPAVAHAWRPRPLLARDDRSPLTLQIVLRVRGEAGHGHPQIDRPVLYVGGRVYFIY